MRAQFVSDDQKREIRQYSEHLIRHKLFEDSGDLKKLLLALVDMKVAYAPPEMYTGAAISERVFRKDRSSPLGKKYGGLLRDTLEEYYATDGRRDRILIILPRGTYEPVIDFVEGVIPDLNDRAAVALWNAETELERRTLTGFMNALRFLGEAAQEHPDHPRVRAMEALVLVQKGLYGFEMQASIKAAARIIEELKSKGTTPWVSVMCDGMVTMAMRWDVPAARKLMDRAAKMSHGMSEMHPFHTALLASQGEFSEAIELMRESIETGRHSAAIARSDLAALLILGGQLDEADRLLDRTLGALSDSHYLLYVHKALVAEARGNAARAVEWIDRIPVTAAESRITIGLRMLFAGLAGAPDEEGYDRLTSANKAGEVPATQVGLAALGMGDKDACVAWAAKGALEEHDPMCIWLNSLPFLRHLDNHRGFTDLLRRLGLPPIR